MSSQQQQPRDGASNPPTKPISMALGSKGKAASEAPNGAPKKTAFSFQSSSRSGSNTPTPRAPERTLARRPHHGLHGGDSDDDNDDEAAPVHQEVTGFDTMTGTAIAADNSHEKQPLVIPVSSNNNWRDRPGVNLARPKGKKNLLPREVQAMQEAQRRGAANAGSGGDVETEGPSMSYGLSLAQPTAGQEGDESGDRLMTDAEPVDRETPQAARKPLTQDEVALQALIRETQGDAGDARRSDLVIESTAGADGRYDETTSFKADVAARPEPASLDQYNAIPVEDFGAALLRGMGWKEGQAVGRGKYGSNNAKAVGAPKVPERRPGFLGIGAKDASGGKGAEAELGAWGRAAMRKGSRKSGKEGEPNTEGVYMPVMMRNSKTGEIITEEELSALQKDSKTKKTDDDEWKERRDRNLEKSGRDRDRDSRRRRDDDYDDRSEKKSSRRDRSRSSSDRHSRRRKYDDDDDDRYYRDRDDKDRERRRERDRDSDRDRDRSHRYRDDDRYSSSRHSSKESSRHGRDRERDRDRGSDRDRDSHRRRR
ncbi:hypothetical protein P168DRAFT_306337 [Aspergillus campestris IBT 28561]|uniref:Pre-mRNA-splicing factor n=1 Tax=Aspergillus campestris (strain IBT 28561) TaxID=1392248 RepID=A0A2I1CX04_ASPC2|nr:uncharacterized protein P168DRAFT_306337 [Aspergillus campestris IBT 28561]PKY02145.1 hypothetical protein P168DRAFT_306337 [Aspergillus campestris IBT 28561]